MLIKEFLIIGTLYSVVNSSSLEYDGSVIIKLQHSLQGGSHSSFTERGNISIHSLRLGQAIVRQIPLTAEDKQKLQILAINNEFYRLKSTVISSDGAERTFLSTVKACMLGEAELDDRISVSLDYMGRVIAVTMVIASKSSCEGASLDVDKLKEFTTSVYVRHAETGPIPDTATYIQKLEREKETREKGDVKDNRSFLAKYWMYIVPIVIIMVISSATSQDTQGGGAA
ncbi:ER membrane protein complex subunit 10 [Cylas formicarius]|uniref:ER membrane protein complex subunit 10 n=1 Tax=Cylas formicarius TaxID=197179 RepID=UPI002958A899|nr:ER membrane protein complex subunit 10 [Cylas formicarius]